ncbi:YeiH family protein [Mesonia sp. K7]|uniref:YeiH family protein n=1 Tax=Mesonia sp. K7 TaxID=2218606 RepID=UPI000DAACB56|nr:putative sulfate exporter family transporter [Mesonia sp. K7]PZD78284.1 putative sulfate exporter family transporter [Mesonia sp. K7]
MKDTLVKVLFFVIILVSLLGFFTSAMALIAGVLFTLFFGNPYQEYTKKAFKLFLKIAIIGLGFGMFFKETLKTSKEAFIITVISIFLTITIGLLLTKALRLEKKLGYLISSGTAICGGSAIAAISPIINAKGKNISLALGIVFLLNSIALLLFPSVGEWLDLTQEQFGLWCAIAIHDTSSVVGASLDYGEEALKVATTTKLARTLWIIPLSLFSMFLFKGKNSKIKFPFFILYFIIAIAINSYFSLPKELTNTLVLMAKRLMVLTLFLVGLEISVKELKTIGPKPILLGLSLWIFVSIFSLLYIIY